MQPTRRNFRIEKVKLRKTRHKVNFKQLKNWKASTIVSLVRMKLRFLYSTQNAKPKKTLCTKLHIESIGFTDHPKL